MSEMYTILYSVTHLDNASSTSIDVILEDDLNRFLQFSQQYSYGNRLHLSISRLNQSDREFITRIFSWLDYYKECTITDFKYAPEIDWTVVL